MDIKTLIDDLLAWDFTQQEIGKIIGVSQTTVSKIHRGAQDDIGYRHYLKTLEAHKIAKRKVTRKTSQDKAMADANLSCFISKVLKGEL